MCHFVVILQAPLGSLAESVELRTWDRGVLDLSLVRGEGGGLCPWAKTLYPHRSTAEVGCGDEAESRVSRIIIQTKMYAPERVIVKKLYI